MPHPGWPLFDLTIRTPRVELRLPTDDELGRLCDVARDGIHDPAVMPFQVPWTDVSSPQFERSFLQYNWLQRATWTPDRWHLPFGVFVDGGPVGSQSLEAAAFPVLRTVSTGSWLGLPFQGRGLGKEMRAAVLHLAFAGLDADMAETSAFADNVASMRVTASFPYEDNGLDRVAPRGEAVVARRFRLTRERWETVRRDDVEITGLEACRELFGA